MTDRETGILAEPRGQSMTDSKNEKKTDKRNDLSEEKEKRAFDIFSWKSGGLKSHRGDVPNDFAFPLIELFSPALQN